MAPGVRPIAGIIGQASPGKGRARIRPEKGKAARKGSRVSGHPKLSTVRQHTRANLRGPDCVSVSCVQIAPAFQLHQGEEKGEQGGFGHKKRPTEVGPIGKGDFIGWQGSVRGKYLRRPPD